MLMSLILRRRVSAVSKDEACAQAAATIQMRWRSYLQFWQIINFRFRAPSSRSRPFASGLDLASLAAPERVGGVMRLGLSTSSTVPTLKPS